MSTPPFRIRLHVTLTENHALVKALLTHPMENGFGKNAQGALIPAHFIEQVTVLVNEEPVVTTHTGSGIAADPLFGWRIRGVKAGDTVSVVWQDNQGLEGRRDTVVRAAP